jgi:hypothetical protein
MKHSGDNTMDVRSPDRLIQAIPQEPLLPRPATASRVRLGAVSFVAAGLLFVLYPAIRPFSDEASLQGATAFASPAWILAHMLAMLGFTLLAVGLVGWYLSLQQSAVEHLAFRALVLSLLGIGLTLPFYGGEAFGLHAIGQEAIRQHNAALVSMANVVRSGPGLVMFLVGLVLLAGGTIILATAVWKSGAFPKWSGLPLAVGFALYIPQFFGTQPIRVAHGLLVAAGCLWLAGRMWRQHTTWAGEDDRASGRAKR